MNDKIKDYLKLGSLILLNIAIYFLIFCLEASRSRLSNPSDIVLITQYFILLAIPSILAYKLISYYNIMRQAIASLAILNTAILLFWAIAENTIVQVLLGLLLLWHVVLYLLSIRKEKKQLQEEEQRAKS